MKQSFFLLIFLFIGHFIYAQASGSYLMKIKYDRPMGVSIGDKECKELKVEYYVIANKNELTIETRDKIIDVFYWVEDIIDSSYSIKIKDFKPDEVYSQKYFYLERTTDNKVEIIFDFFTTGTVWIRFEYYDENREVTLIGERYFYKSKFN